MKTEKAQDFLLISPFEEEEDEVSGAPYDIKQRQAGSLTFPTYRLWGENLNFLWAHGTDNTRSIPSFPYNCMHTWERYLHNPNYPTGEDRTIHLYGKTFSQFLEQLVQSHVNKSLETQERILRVKLTAIVRNELLPEIRKEVLRELSTGELFQDVPNTGGDFVDWVNNHKEMFKQLPSTNVAVDMDEAVVVLDDKNELNFARKLAVLEKEKGKRYRTFHTDSLPNS